jgi:hypothetical protein
MAISFGRLLRDVVRTRVRAASGRSTRRRPQAEPVGYPGDFTGVVRPVYSPDLDGDPDPGEIVWTWVPYEEDHSRGKDRPVLVVGRDGAWLLGLMLSTRDHDAGAARRDERWLDLGHGDWDVEHRESEIRVDRVVRVDPAGVRREGAVLDRTRFDLVVGSLAAARG